VAGTEKLSPEAEQLAMTTVQLASAFLFTVGFHTKKSVRGENIFSTVFYFPNASIFTGIFFFFFIGCRSTVFGQLSFDTKILVLQHWLNHPCNS
jgi:hypothetical protein